MAAGRVEFDAQAHGEGFQDDRTTDLVTSSAFVNPSKAAASKPFKGTPDHRHLDHRLPMHSH